MKLIMDERLKHRLVGLAVIVSVGAIFAPVMMKKDNKYFDQKIHIVTKLPKQPALPEVNVPTKQTMFESVKVAHVNIPATHDNFVPVTIAKADNLTPVIHSQKLDSESKLVPVVINTPSKVKAKPQPEAVKVSKATTNKNERLLTKNKPAVAGKNIYAVQLATFSKKENAQALMNRLKSKGYVATVSQSTGKNGVVFKVIVGYTNEKQKAASLQQQLASVLQMKGFVIETNRIS